MATVGTVTAYLRLNSKQFIGAMRQATMSMKANAKKIESIGKQMTMKLTAPIALMGGMMLKSAADFERGMNSVRALTNATGQAFTDLRDQAMALGASTRFSATEAAAGMAFLAKAGFTTNEILKAMPDTLNLAAAAGLDLATAADIVSNIMKGMRVPVERLGYATDVLTNAFTSSNTDLVQLGEAMKYVGPVAAGFGQSLQDTVAMLGALGNAGIQASLAGTTLRGALVSVANASTAGKEILKRYTVEVKNAEGGIRPLIDIVRELEAKGITATEAMELFGRRAGSGMIALLELGGEGLERYSKSLDEAGSTARIADTMMEGLHGAWIELKSALEGLNIVMGDTGFLKNVEGMVDSLKGLINWVKGLNSDFLAFSGTMAVVIATIGPIVAVFGVFLSVVSPVAIGIGALVVAGAALVAAMVIWRTEIADFVTWFASGFVNALIAGINGAIKAFALFPLAFANMVAGLVDAAAKGAEFLGFSDSMVESMRGTAKALRDTGDAIFALEIPLVDLTTNFSAEAVAADVATAAVKRHKEATEDAAAAAKRAAKEQQKAAADLASGFAALITQIEDAKLTDFDLDTRNLEEDFKTWAVLAGKDVDTVIARFRALREELKNTGPEIKGVAIDLGKTVGESMSTMVDGVLRGTKSMGLLFADFFEGVALSFGKDFIQQFFLDKLKFEIKLEKNFQDLFGKKLPDIMDSFADHAFSVLNEVGSALWSVLKAVGSGIGSWMGGGGFGSGISDWFVGTYGGFAGTAAGGVVTSPQVRLVGEAGPEAIIPLDQMGSMGGGAVTVNVYADDEASVERSQDGGEINVMIGAMIEDIRKLGPVTRTLVSTYDMSRVTPQR